MLKKIYLELVAIRKELHAIASSMKSDSEKCYNKEAERKIYDCPF